MTDGQECIDAVSRFVGVMSDLMTEMGIDESRFTVDELRQIIRDGTAKFNECLDEFYLWAVRQIMEQDEKRTLTRLLLKEQIKITRS